MKDEKDINIAKKWYRSLLTLYPERYRRKFGEEMIFVFEEMYQDYKGSKTGFWFGIGKDTMQGVMREHIDDIHKFGMKQFFKKTLHITTYSIIGGILLLPFFTIFIVDILSRIAQGDLVHYNRPVYQALSKTPFYQFPLIALWALVFPLAALVINIIPLALAMRKKGTHIFSIQFAQRNLATFGIIAIGGMFLLILFGHDVIPCTVHGILNRGFLQFLNVANYCRLNS